MEESTAITVVKVFAVLNWIGSGIAILAGLIALVAGPTVLASMAMDDMAGMGAVMGGAAIVIGALAIVLGIIGIFIGRGLWQHKNWARIVTLVFAVVSVLSIFGGNFLGAIIGGLQVWLFGFEKTVVGLFK